MDKSPNDGELADYEDCSCFDDEEEDFVLDENIEEKPDDDADDRINWVRPKLNAHRGTICFAAKCMKKTTADAVSVQNAANTTNNNNNK